MKYLPIAFVLTGLIAGAGCSQTPVSVNPDSASTEVSEEPTARSSIYWMQVAGIALLVGVSASSMSDSGSN